MYWRGLLSSSDGYSFMNNHQNNFSIELTASCAGCWYPLFVDHQELELKRDLMCFTLLF